MSAPPIYIDPITKEGNASDEYAGLINTGLADAKLPSDYVEKYSRKFIKNPSV